MADQSVHRTTADEPDQTGVALRSSRSNHHTSHEHIVYE